MRNDGIPVHRYAEQIECVALLQTLKPVLAYMLSDTDLYSCPEECSSLDRWPVLGDGHMLSILLFSWRDGS